MECTIGMLAACLQAVALYGTVMHGAWAGTLSNSLLCSVYMTHSYARILDSPDCHMRPR